MSELLRFLSKPECNVGIPHSADLAGTDAAQPVQRSSGGSGLSFRWPVELDATAADQGSKLEQAQRRIACMESRLKAARVPTTVVPPAHSSSAQAQRADAGARSNATLAHICPDVHAPVASSAQGRACCSAACRARPRHETELFAPSLQASSHGMQASLPRTCSSQQAAR